MGGGRWGGDTRDRWCQKSLTWASWIWPAHRGKSSLTSYMSSRISSHQARHRIDTGDHPAIKASTKIGTMHKQGTASQQVDNMGQQGVVQPSTSPWAAPIVLVRKKDGTTRFCGLSKVERRDQEGRLAPAACRWHSGCFVSYRSVHNPGSLVSGYWLVEVDAADVWRQRSWPAVAWSDPGNSLRSLKAPVACGIRPCRVVVANIW